MSITEQSDVFANAADMAKTLGMRRKNDLTTLRFGQPVLMVTPAGITVGNIRNTFGREDGYRYDMYILNNTTLCTFTFNRLPNSIGKESLWEETPSVEMTLPEGAILYAGRIPKSELRSTSKTNRRY